MLDLQKNREVDARLSKVSVALRERAVRQTAGVESHKISSLYLSSKLLLNTYLDIGRYRTVPYLRHLRCVFT